MGSPSSTQRSQPAPRHRFAGAIPPGVTPAVPGPGQGSVWDYPRPPRVEAVAPQVRVLVDGITIADTHHALRVLETAGAPTIYIPREDVRTDLLVRSKTTSACEWKGDAAYWTLHVESREIADVAWSYARPMPPMEPIAGHFAFYPGRVDEAWLGDERARPQPGRFYGGWVTDAIVGPIKGGPGTFGW